MAAEKFSISWNEFGSTVINTFKNLFSDKHFTDVTLVSEDGKQVKAHKVVLSSCSPFFNKVLLLTPHQQPIIFLKGIKHSELLAIVQFIYLGQTDLAQDDLNQFMGAAADLQIEGLQGNQKPVSKTNFDTRTNTEIVPQNTIKENLGVDIIKNGSIHETPEEWNEQMYYKSQREDIQVKVNGGYTCDRCDYRTQKISNLKPHQISKHDGVKFVCDQCDRQFSTKTNLQTHKQAKHEGKTFICEECDFETSYPTNFSNHKAKVHKILQ